MSDFPDKLFNEQEVSRLLRRAAERQEADRTQHHEVGLSLEEVRQLADELGIDPKYVALAVQDITAGHEDLIRESALIGGPIEINLERVVRGALSDETVARMLVEIRKTYTQSRGQFEKIGRHFSWSPGTGHYPSTQPPLISVTPEGQNTRIRIYENAKNLLGLYAIPIMFLIPAILTAIASAPIGVPLTFFSITVLLPIILYLSMRTTSRKRSKKHIDLMDTLQRIAEEGAVQSRVQTGETTSQGRIAQDLLDDPAPESDESVPGSERKRTT